MNSSKFAVAILASVLLLPGTPTAAQSPGAKKAFPVVVVDDQHNRITIPRRPERIVSLDPRDTETLFALGLERRVKGDSPCEGAHSLKRAFRYPSEWPSRLGRDYPTRSVKIPHVGQGDFCANFNLEVIASLSPDLVFTLWENSDAYRATLQKLHDLHIKVIILNPTSLNGIFHDIQLVGRATGAGHQASVVVANMKRQLKYVAKRLAKTRSRPRTLYEIDPSPYVVGPGTYIDQLITAAKGRNAASQVREPGCPGSLCYPKLNLEALVRLDPQVIVLGDDKHFVGAYGTSVGEVKSRPGWNTISAVRTGRIYPFDDDLISRAGPRVSVGVEKLARVIHPEAFKTRG